MPGVFGHLQTVGGGSGTPTVVYEYRDIWAEEGGGLADNASQWSYGNGAGGFIGLPIDAGWEVEALYFHADISGATSDVTVHMVDMRTPSVAAPIITTIDVVDSGQGVGNNAWQFTTLATPVAVPDGAVLGFRTGDEQGAYSDARMGARLRRPLGSFLQV